MTHFFHEFLHLCRDSIPLFILGAAIGSALEVWLPRGWVDRWLANGRSSVFLASVAGALLPGCAMSTMPLAGALRRRGVPIGTVAAFIMIAPILSPHTIVLTATLISVPMAVARVVLAFVAACGLGLLLNAFASSAPAAEPEKEESCGCCCGGKKATPEEKPIAEPEGFRAWWKRFLESLRELSPFLFGGLAVAAALLAWVPVEKYRSVMSGGWQAYAVAVIIGIPAYVCDGGEIPLTRALLSLGVGIGPAFCFMLASVGTCFATISMAVKIIGWRPMLAYLAAWLVLAIGGGVLVGIVLPMLH